MTSAMFPGKLIQLDEESGLMARVFTVGTKHLRKFSRQIGNAISSISSMKLPSIKDKKAMEAWAAAELAPILINDAFDILTDCIKVFTVDEAGVETPFQLDELPHYHLPVLIVTWFEDSFGEEKKIRPWIEAFQKLSKALPTPQKTG